MVSVVNGFLCLSEVLLLLLNQGDTHPSRIVEPISGGDECMSPCPKCISDHEEAGVRSVWCCLLSMYCFLQVALGVDALSLVGGKIYSTYLKVTHFQYNSLFQFDCDVSLAMLNPRYVE